MLCPLDCLVPFEVSLRDRLDLLRPSSASVASCVSAHPASFSPGFESFLCFLRGWYSARHDGAALPVFLVSGGFRPLIEPLRLQMGVASSCVYANSLRFAADGSGAYDSFDASEPTSRSGGKARALDSIVAAHGYSHVTMVGDGATDLEAAPPAKLMVGYGGIAQREAVKRQAHVFVQSWDELRQIIESCDVDGDDNELEEEAATAVAVQ